MPQDTQNPVPATEPKNNAAMGPLIGALIVLLVLVVGGFYLWEAKKAQERANELPYILGDTDTSAGLPPTSNSDAEDDILRDLDNTDLDTLEAEIDADLRAAQQAL